MDNRKHATQSARQREKSYLSEIRSLLPKLELSRKSNEQAEVSELSMPRKTQTSTEESMQVVR